MATVTGLTAARTLELLDTMIVGADVVGDDLILTKEDGSTVNAGSVIGPDGPIGPIGPAGPTGPRGGSSFSLITGGPNVTITDPNTITFGAAGWGSGVRSLQGFARGVWCSARVSPTLDHVMFGLNSDPAASDGFADIDYALYVTSGGILQAYESGINTVIGTALSTDVLSVTYDGVYVRYWKNGVVQRSVLRSIGLPLYFDSSAAPTVGVTLSDVYFGPMGEMGPAGDMDLKNSWVDDMTRPRHIKDAILDPSSPGGAVALYRTYSAATGLTLTSGSGTQDFTLYAKEIQLVDHRVVTKFRFSGASASMGNLLKVRTTAFSLLCYADPVNLYIFLGSSGAGGALAGPIAISGGVTLNTDFWLESSIVGNVITSKIYNADPDIGAPAALATVTYTLLSTNAGNLGTGRHGSPGIRGAAHATGPSSVNFRQVRIYAL